MLGFLPGGLLKSLCKKNVHVNSTRLSVVEYLLVRYAGSDLKHNFLVNTRADASHGKRHVILLSSIDTNANEEQYQRCYHDIDVD